MAIRSLPLDDVMIILKRKALEREEKLVDNVSVHVQLTDIHIGGRSQSLRYCLHRQHSRHQHSADSTDSGVVYCDVV